MCRGGNFIAVYTHYSLGATFVHTAPTQFQKILRSLTIALITRFALEEPIFMCLPVSGAVRIPRPQ